jgi:hypothetical protein
VVIFYTNNSAADRCIESLESIGTTPEEAVRISYSGYRMDPRRQKWYVRFDSENELEMPEIDRLRRASVLVATTYQARKVLELTKRPLIIYDEISLVSPADFMSSLAYAKSWGRDMDYVVQIGDPHQLPVVTHQRELEVNAATFLRARSSEIVPRRLEVQYRMHETICSLVNTMRQALRAYPLRTHESVARRNLTDKFGRPTKTPNDRLLKSIVDPNAACVVVNSDMLQGSEERRGASWVNEKEADFSIRVARELKLAYPGLEPVTMAPYTAQVSLLERLGKGEIDAKTVHEMQGREYPCVILSLVRQNPQGDIGFVGSTLPLTYVAYSRAQMKLVVLMSFSTFDRKREYPEEVLSFLRTESEHLHVIGG